MSVRVRMATLQDAAACAAIYAPYVRETGISFESEPPDAQEMRARLATTLSRFPWLVAESGGTVAGYAYAGPHETRPAYRWSATVSVYLDRSAMGRGLGRRLYAALLEILRAQGYICAYAGVALPNAASVGLHEAMGFAPVGVYRDVGFKAGQWYDVGWWQRRLCDRPDAPAEPIPWPALPPTTLEAALTPSS